MGRTLASHFLVHGQWTGGDGAGWRATATTSTLDTPWLSSGTGTPSSCKHCEPSSDGPAQNIVDKAHAGVGAR